jgi:hypothetical protein
MQHTTAWNSGPTSNALPGLLQHFGCTDIVAPVDADAFATKASELICRKQWKTVTRNERKHVTPTAKPVMPTAGKYRLLALQCREVAAQTHDPYAQDMLLIAARELVRVADGAYA